MKRTPYLLVKEPEALPAVEAGLRSVLLGNLQQDEEETATYQLQPLEEIYLHSDHKGAELGRSGNIRYLYLFVGIALLVLLVACINYVNLATAHAMRRAREVGIRKVAGATRMQLVGRFLGESLLLSVVAAFMGVLLVELALPTFNQLVQKNIAIAYFSTGSILPEVVATALLVGMTAGLYPAFFLSAYRPVSVLRGTFFLQGGGLWLRRTLVVFQFVLSTVLIMATLVVQKQLTYIRNASLGFNEEHVLTIHTSGISVNRDAFKQAVAQIPGVKGVTTAGIGPRLNAEVFPEGFTDPEEGIRAYITFVDHNFTDVMDIEMIEGRSFSESYATDEQDAVLVNATAVNRFNWGNAENAIGKTILKGDKKYRVIGVVDDFHYRSLKVIIAPLIIDIDPARSARSPLSVRVGSENIQVTLAALERSWKAVSDRPFRYTFMDEAIESSYNGEIRLAQIFGYFAFLAIGIACLGLFGLASYTVQQRTKEIGVRKVLGASSVQILALFSKEYLKLIGLALILAMPAVYFVMDQWLLNFAYRTTIGISTFILVSTLLFLITILTVGYQSVRAASADPVISLRYE